METRRWARSPSFQIRIVKEKKRKKERKGRKEEMDNGKSAIVEIRAESFEDRLERPFKDAFSEKAP